MPRKCFLGKVYDSDGFFGFLLTGEFGLIMYVTGISSVVCEFIGAGTVYVAPSNLQPYRVLWVCLIASLLFLGIALAIFRRWSARVYLTERGIEEKGTLRRTKRISWDDVTKLILEKRGFKGVRPVLHVVCGDKSIRMALRTFKSERAVLGLIAQACPPTCRRDLRLTEYIEFLEEIGSDADNEQEVLSIGFEFFRACIIVVLALWCAVAGRGLWFPFAVTMAPFSLASGWLGRLGVGAWVLATLVVIALSILTWTALAGLAARSDHASRKTFPMWCALYYLGIFVTVIIGFHSPFVFPPFNLAVSSGPLLFSLFLIWAYVFVTGHFSLWYEYVSNGWEEREAEADGANGEASGRSAPAISG